MVKFSFPEGTRQTAKGVKLNLRAPKRKKLFRSRLFSLYFDRVDVLCQTDSRRVPPFFGKTGKMPRGFAR
jgi:hypothetical protein